MLLVARAIKSGIYNDLGSGSNVDLCVITKEGTEMLRGYEVLDQKTYTRKFPVIFKTGTASEWASRLAEGRLLQAGLCPRTLAACAIICAVSGWVSGVTGFLQHKQLLQSLGVFPEGMPQCNQFRSVSEASMFAAPLLPLVPVSHTSQV